MANSVLEDEIIETLEQIDQAQAQIAEAESTLAAAREKQESVGAEVQKQQPVLEDDVGRLEAELKRCEAQLPPTVRDMYQRIVRGRGEDALAIVEDEFCGGCHQHVPLNVQAEIRLSHPMFCRSCGRLLYFPENAPMVGDVHE
jgi:predicted  nucleic acid-binding Zn-ribbon protein